MAKLTVKGVVTEIKIPSPLFGPIFRLFGFKGYRLPIDNILFNNALRNAIAFSESSSFDSQKDG
jgi:hypothetical protein